MKSIFVLMSSYNGELYIEEQIKSIRRADQRNAGKGHGGNRRWQKKEGS